MSVGDYERLPPGSYVLRYDPGAGVHGRAGLRLDGPTGLYWSVRVVAKSSLLDWLEGDDSDPEIDARLKAVLVEAAVPIVREMIEQERLPASVGLLIELDDRHYGLAHAVNSTRRLDIPRDHEVVLRVERSHRPGPRGPNRTGRPRGRRRQPRSSR